MAFRSTITAQVKPGRMADAIDFAQRAYPLQVSVAGISSHRLFAQESGPVGLFQFEYEFESIADYAAWASGLREHPEFRPLFEEFTGPNSAFEPSTRTFVNQIPLG